MTINLDHGKRRPVPAGKPIWAQIGPFEATSIERKEDRVTFEIQVPNDAPVGILMDCHIEFAGSGGRGGPIVFKKNDVFRVVE